MEAGSAGPSSQISFLFEYEGSRRCLRVSCPNKVPDAIICALQETFGTHFTLKCLLASASVDEEPVEVQGTHIIQRWSEEFNCFVDVVSVIEVESGDKLTVTTCPKVPVS